MLPEALAHMVTFRPPKLDGLEALPIPIQTNVQSLKEKLWTIIIYLKRLAIPAVSFRTVETLWLGHLTGSSWRFHLLYLSTPTGSERMHLDIIL